MRTMVVLLGVTGLALYAEVHGLVPQLVMVLHNGWVSVVVSLFLGITIFQDLHELGQK